MAGCGGGTCGISRERERERAALLALIAERYPGLVFPGSEAARPPVSRDEARALGDRFEAMLPVRAFLCPADDASACDWLYLLAGIHPRALLEFDAGLLPPGERPLRSEETYLRLGFSALGRYVTLQEATISLDPGEGEGLSLLTEETRVGVVDPRLALIVKGVQGALRKEHLVVLDAAFLTQPVVGARFATDADREVALASDDEPPLVWNFVFEATPPGTRRMVCL